MSALGRAKHLRLGRVVLATAAGSNGTPFLQDYSGVYKVVKEPV